MTASQGGLTQEDLHQLVDLYRNGNISMSTMMSVVDPESDPIGCRVPLETPLIGYTLDDNGNLTPTNDPNVVIVGWGFFKEPDPEPDLVCRYLLGEDVV